MNEDLQIGAHLVTPRRGFVHHGIYAGAGRVIHYRGYNLWLRRGPIEEVSIEEFTRGRGFREQPSVAPRYLGTERVERARTRVGENHYSLLRNNCEHFCEWTINGRARSRQIETRQARFFNPLIGWTRSIARQLGHAFSGPQQPA